VLRLVNVEIYAHWEFSRFVRVEMLQLVATLGDIPSDLWHMPSLRTLEMEALEGLEDLPADIPASAGLQRLVLRECYELGLPEKITNLRRLTELCVENGRFGGRLGEEGMDGLTSLETLKLVNALVEDSPLPRLDRMTNLRRIEYKDDSNERLLQRTDAVGPSDIGQLDGLTRLMSVDIGECLPQNLVFSTGAPLTRLCISNVYGAAQLPPSIANLGQLRELYLSNFTNINTWPANFSRLTSLTKLDILLCDIGNADNITLLTNLRSLSMDGDFFPNSIGQLTGLHSLELVSQAIGPDLPPDITRLTNLARLKLDVGCSSHFFPKLSYLRRLRECHLTYHDSYEQPADRAGEPDPLDTMFFEATSLTSLTLNVEDDRIGLYEPWTGHSNLRELEVGGRRFSNLRSYCDSTKRLTKLTRLAVPSPGNMEYASVPRLPNLRALEFTEMVGRLPAGISQLHDLQELKLSEKGTLCMQVTELRSLRRIGGGMKWAGDAEHVRAVAGLARMGVKLDLCR
jgi:Leucine-rich repeat (LRR) protein